MKKIALILMLCLLAPMSTINAQTTITIDKDGSNTVAASGTQYYPIYTNYSYPYSVSQMIYTESQLTEANGGVIPSGNITNLSFVTTDDNTVTGTRRWRVYIKYIENKNQFSNTSGWELMGDGDKYFENDVTLSVGGDVNIKLDGDGFHYSGGNIVICVCEDGGATTSSRAKFKYFKPTVTYRSLVLMGSSAYNPSSLGTAKYAYQQTPVLKLTFAAAVAKFDLNVNVTDGTNPLEGATVTISGANSDGSLKLEGKTNASGQYVSSDLLQPSTCYTVTVSKTGYKTVTEQVCAQNIQNDSYTLNVAMTAAPEGPVSLRTDKDTYDEYESVTFYWDKVNNPNVKYYRLYKKTSGQWNLVVTVGADAGQYTVAAGYAFGEYEFCVTAVYQNDESEKGEASASMMVFAKGIVSGNVRNDGGNPLRDVKVVLEYVSGGKYFSYETMTDSNGNFKFTDVKTGTYKIMASKVGYYEGVKTDVVVSKGATARVGVIFLTPYQHWECDVVATLQKNGTDNIYTDDYVEVTWSGVDANTYTYYNIYRKNIETGVVELVSHYTNITNQYYRDNEWSSLEDGRYQYGVSAFTGELEDVLNEDFNKGGVMPEGWSFVAPYGSEWFMSNSERGTGSINYAYDDDVYQQYGYMKDPTLYWAGSAGLNGKYYFITPKLNVKDALLSFYYATPFPSEDPTPALNVCWSTNPTGPWTNVWDAGFTYFNWWNTELDLSNLPEKYVYLAFCSNTPDQYSNYGGGKYYRAAVDAVALKSRVETLVLWSNELEKETSVIFYNATGDCDWHNPANWSTNKIPTASDNAQILADAIVFSGNAVTANINITDLGTLTIDNGATYKSTGTIRIYDNDPSKFVINDGAQVYQNNPDVKATFNMNIANPTSWGPDGFDHKGGWQFISSPFVDADFSSYVSPASGDYDLYKYDGKVDTLEWRNYKLHHDELFCNFNVDMEGWTARDDNKDNVTWEYAVFREGCDGVSGCVSLAASVASNDYIVSSRKLNIYPESKLRFYVKLHNNDQIPMMLNEGLDILYSKDESFTSGFNVINTVTSYSTSGWTEVVVDLSSIASTTEDVDAEEAWIAIRFNLPAISVDNVLIDNIELANVYDKATPFEKTFLQGRGYMASYESATTVSIVGTLYHENSFVYDLDYNADDRWENFYLLGNPFPYDLTWSEFAHSGIVPGFAVVNSTSGAYQYEVDVNNTIKAGDGFMVLTNASNPTLSVNATRGASRKASDYINVVATGVAGSDNLIVSLSGKENGGFFKLENFNEDIASVYVLNYEDMYGIANYDEDVEEVDFCFIANNMGYYTISMMPKGEFTSVKLYDRVEDVEVDMMQNKEYKFFALSEDYANESRFVLKYEKKGAESDGTFAYQSGDDLVVNAEGLIQIMDVMGRIVHSGEYQTVNNRIDVSGLKNATYVIRNIKNNEVRTQKIVIL